MTLLEEARRIAPTLQASAVEDDALRRIGDGTWKELLASGALRALQPTRFGGGEVSLLEFVDVSMVCRQRRHQPVGSARTR